MAAQGRMTITAICAAVAAGQTPRILVTDDQYGGKASETIPAGADLAPAKRKTGVHTATVTGYEVATIPGGARRGYRLITDLGTVTARPGHETVALAAEGKPGTGKARVTGGSTTVAYTSYGAPTVVAQTTRIDLTATDAADDSAPAEDMTADQTAAFDALTDLAKRTADDVHGVRFGSLANGVRVGRIDPADVPAILRAAPMPQDVRVAAERTAADLATRITVADTVTIGLRDVRAGDVVRFPGEVLRSTVTASEWHTGYAMFQVTVAGQGQRMIPMDEPGAVVLCARPGVAAFSAVYTVGQPVTVWWDSAEHTGVVESIQATTEDGPPAYGIATAAASNGTGPVVCAWNMRPAGAGFHPGLVRIERQRRSVTQGSVTLFYAGQLLGQRGYNDEPTRCRDHDNGHGGAQCVGGMHGKPDAHWLGVAQRLHAPAVPFVSGWATFEQDGQASA